MTDIFAKEGIQVDDVNPASPVAGAVDALGQATSRPSGQPDIGGGADKLQAPAPQTGGADSALPPDNSAPRDMTSSAVPMPAPPSYYAAMGVEPGQPDDKATGPQAVPAPPAPPPMDNAGAPAPTGPRDIFAAENIPAPTIPEVNQNAMNAGADLVNPTTPGDIAAKQYVNQQDQQTMMLARSRFTPEQIQAIKDKGPITFSEVGHYLTANDVLPGGGVFKAIDALELNAAANKLKNGATFKDLSVEEESVMNTYVDRQLEENIRGFSIGGKIAYSGSQIPAWVTEFVATGGVGKLAQQAALKAGEEAAIHGAVNATAGFAARTLVQTSLMLPQYAAKYGELRVNDSVALTDKGDLLARESTETPAVSALKAFGYTAADVAAQLAAPAIGKYVIDPATKALSTPLVAAVNAVPVATRQALYMAYKMIQPSATVSKVFTQAGWSGMLEQLGANRVDQIVHSTIDFGTNKKETFDDYLKAMTPDKDQLLVEGGLLAVAGGIHTAASVGTNLLIAHGVQPARAADMIDTMSANEKEQFVQKNLNTPKSAFPSLASEPEPVHSDAVEAAPADVTKSQIQAKQDNSPPPVLDQQSGFNAAYKTTKKYWMDNIYPELFNDIQPIEDLATKAKENGAEVTAGMNTGLLARQARNIAEMINYNLQVGTSHFDEDGNMVQTGKSLKAIRDDFDNMFLTTEPDLATRHQDMNDYQLAQTFIEDHEKGLSEVSPQLLEKSTNDLANLANKYGENFPFFETFAQEEREWDKRILYNNVQSGVWSQEKYDDVIGRREKYAPTGRIVEDEGFIPSVSGKSLGKDTNPNKIGSLKQRMGSDLEVRDVMKNRIKNASQIIANSALNRLKVTTAKFAEFYPDDVKVSNPRIIEHEVKQSYDPKLRAKLETTAQLFGDEVKRMDKLEGNALGSYSASEKLVRMKIGTTEGTLAHEIGHMLDYKLGLKEMLLEEPGVRKQLQKLAQDRLMGKIDVARDPEGELHFRETLQGENATQKYKDYVNSDREILANMFDAYVNSPEQLKEVAPKALKAFEKIIDKNKDLAILRDIKPSTARAEEVVRKPVRDLLGPKDAIPFYENGKRKFLEVSEPLQKAFKGIGPSRMGIIQRLIFRAATAPTRLLRFGATTTPEFILRHALRGVYTSFLNTEGKATPLGFAKGIFDVLGRSQDFHDFAASSGNFNTFKDLSEKAINKEYVKMFQEPSKIQAFNPLRMISVLRDVGDKAPRVAAFKAYKEGGMSDLEAGVAALDATGDFGRHGSFIKKLNQFFPFFNDMMQGGDRLVRAFKKNPAGYTARAIAVITVPQVMMAGYYLYAADNKTRQEYLELPMWRRQLFMNIKVGDHWVPIPRPFAPGYIFGALPEQIMVHEYHGYHPEPKNAWFEMMKGAANSVSPIFDWSKAMPPIFKAAIEDITNYSFFAEHPIYDPDMRKLPPSERANTFTSESAKALGSLFNFSPAMIDETVQVMGGNLGKYAMELGDYGIDKVHELEGMKVAQKPSDLSNVPFVRGFVERDPSGNSSESAQEFYNSWDEVSQQHAKLNSLTGKDQSSYAKENRAALDQYEMLKDAHKQISGLNKDAKAVYANTSMSGDLKQNRLEKINNQITDIARKANIQYRKSTGAHQ